MTAPAGQSLSSLLSQATLEDHEVVLKAANIALKKSKQDVEAQHARVVALLKLDRFEEALRALEDGGHALTQKAQLELAYALYKNGKLEEAKEAAVKPPQSRGSKHLEAQANYRAEHFSRAAELYKELSQKTMPDDSPSDLKINTLATEAQLLWSGQEHLVTRTKPGREDLEAFETTYNIACAYVARGELKQAELLLKRARDLCNAVDELSEHEKRTELLPLNVQLLYVLCKLDKVEDAEKLCSTLEINDAAEFSTKHIAQTNILKTSPLSSNPYVAHRMYLTTSTYPKTDLPFSFQSSQLWRNAMTLDLAARKFNGVGDTTTTFLSKQSLPSTNTDAAYAAVYNAAAHARCQTGSQAMKAVLSLLQQRSNDVGLILTGVQLYTLRKREASAAYLLEEFLKRLETAGSPADLDVRYAPGIVAVLASLHARQGQSSRTRAELEKAAAYWRQNPKTGSLSSSLLTAAGIQLLNPFAEMDLKAAHNCFRVVHEQNTNDRVAAAGLVASASQKEPLQPSLIDALPPVNELIAKIDAAGLEDAGIARLPNLPNSSDSSKKRRAATAATESQKPKKIRRSRIPKDYDPEKKPDQERWLPLRDRSYWRPKGKKGKGRIGGGTQGGVSDDSRPATPSASIVSAGASKSKKKKGKGGK